jgi:hypothetical protein
MRLLLASQCKKQEREIVFGCFSHFLKKNECRFEGDGAIDLVQIMTLACQEQRKLEGEVGKSLSLSFFFFFFVRLCAMLWTAMRTRVMTMTMTRMMRRKRLRESAEETRAVLMSKQCTQHVVHVFSRFFYFFNFPIAYCFISSMAPFECPIASKSFVASFPPCSTRTSSPPGCSKRNGVTS